jgi:translation initiation factor 4A
LTLEGIKQFYIAVEDDRQKYATLKNLFSYLSMSQCIIYCNSIKRVQDLFEAMIEDEFPVCRIHSNMDRTERETAFNEFKTGKSRVLISSNVTARGIDIQQVSVVINFDLTKDVHTYLHRIGRSGRWGRKGVGINFITRRDVGKLKEIEQHYSTQISEMPAELGFLTAI